MTDHIKMLPVAPRIAYVGNGVQSQFTFPFPIFKQADLAISVNGALQSGGYTIAGTGQSSGGTVTFTTPPPDNTVILLERTLLLQRITDFLEGGEFSANTLNNELDYIAGCLQQISNDMAPMLRVERSESAFVTTLPGKTQRANKVLGFDGDGQLQVVDTTNTYSVPTYTASGTGAVTRSFTDKAREVASVKDYGAVGNGIANDTNAFINAIAANGAVFVPPGTYLITQTLEIGSNKLLYGAGKTSILKTSGSTFDTLALIGSYATVSDLTIDGGDTGIILYGKTAPCVQNIVQNVAIRNVNIGIEIDGYTSSANPSHWHSFSDIVIEKMAIDGVLITRSGGGDKPMANKFHKVHVASGTTNTTGYGFRVAAGQFNNAFIDCSAAMATTASGCFQAGSTADKTLLINFQAQSTANIPAIKLEAGSTDTSISNLAAGTAGVAINDLSGGNYMTLNAGDTDKNRLRRTRISDLTTELQRYQIQTVAPASATVFPIDLSKTTYLVSAINGVVTMQLPTASAANNGATITIKKVDISILNVLVTENAGTGPDGRTLRLGTLNDYVTVISDGAKWHILNTNTMPQATFIYGTAGVYKPDLTKSFYLVNATAGQVTVELPPANAAHALGKIVTVKKQDGTSNLVRVTEEGALGPDNAAVNMGAVNQAVTVISNGTMWLIISKY